MNTLHTSVERHFLDCVTYICKFGYSLNGLRYGKKEFLLGCKFDGIYEVPHFTCQPINCTLEDALVAKTIDFSGEFLSSSSPVVLGSNEWLKYQCGEGHALFEIPDSSDLFTVTCLDGDHTLTHCKPVQGSACDRICNATGGCFVTITYGKHVEYQREAGYHVGSGHKSGSKPEDCHAKERAEPDQPVQVSEEPMGAVSSCGHVDQQERFASWIGQQDRPFPSPLMAGGLEPAPGATKCLSGQFLVTGPPGTGKTRICPENFPWSVTCENWKDANSRN